MHNLPPVYYIVFTAITAIAVLLQAFVLLALFFVLKKSLAKMLEVTDEVKEQALPLLRTTRGLVEDVSPKLKVATGNLVEVSHTLRHQANHVNESVSELLDKANAQIQRVDGMVSSTLNAVDHATQVIENAVSIPVRRASGVVQGIRTGLNVLLSKKKTAREEAVPAEQAASQTPHTSATGTL